MKSNLNLDINQDSEQGLEDHIDDDQDKVSDLPLENESLVKSGNYEMPIYRGLDIPVVKSDEIIGTIDELDQSNEIENDPAHLNRATTEHDYNHAHRLNSIFKPQAKT